MKKFSLNEVKEKCTEGRFFLYVDFHDRLFVPPAIFLMWFFLRIGWSGNAVTFLSGAFALAGGIMMSSSDPLMILIGSFGYILFYLLDYVDGGVARMRNQSGIGGQYIDWIMHVVAAVGIVGGLFAGALLASGSWIIPFGILAIVATTLSLDRYAFAWFSICMHYQQQRTKGIAVYSKEISYENRVFTSLNRFFRNLSSAIFHENYAIFLLPCLATLHFFTYSYIDIDFRIIIIIFGGVIYFPVVLYDIWKMAVDGRIDNAYGKLFFANKIPNLPEDHFIN
jgi:phosphatidylglycerophosphate synthase